MKKILLLIPMVSGLSSMAWAGACPTTPTPLSFYDSGAFTCTFDGLTFSNFTFGVPTESGGALVPTDSGIEVTPVTIGSDIGLDFTAAWTVGTDQQIKDSFSFDVAGTDITGEELMISGGSASEGGTATVTGSSTPPPESLFTQYFMSSGSPTDSVTFGPQTGVSVTNNVILSGGSTTGGGAGVGDVFDLFAQTTSTVPEPSLVLLCAGLAALVPIARRKFVR